MHFYEIFYGFAVDIAVPRAKHNFHDDVKEVSHNEMFLSTALILVVFEHSEAFVQHKINDLFSLHFRHFVE